MFKKVLIANRGEIACRIIRTLKRMRISSVAVYSEADQEALHVQMADEAYLIGTAPVNESYLNRESILKVALESGAEAIHPGYGFLSENADFAKAVVQKNLIFIGPSSDAIAAMGDKLQAKRIAQLAGVSCLPGTDEPVADLYTAEKISRELGYPVMVKAAAGGGGKGMRIVRNSAFLEEALKGAMSEAKSSFGDSRIFLEKYIDSARHIEIQILADTHGNVIHLGERECSLQRRHQKVIEEAPSPFVTDSLRKKMTDEAIRLAKAMKYTSVGTVEFVVDQERNFYFLEMNTRLQVEHPTTEMITGIDLVEEMIRVSAGEPLRFQQKDVQIKGHAIEARIYAEDSSRGFLPSTGRIRTYLLPLENEGKIRLESGVQEGEIITPYYDPLMAKLIVHESNRNLACETLLGALDGFYIRGVSTNLSFLSFLVNASFFKNHDFNTTILDKLYGEGFTPQAPEKPWIPIGVAAVMHCLRHHLENDSITVLVGRDSYFVEISVAQERAEVKFGKETLIIETQWNPGDVLFEGVFNGHLITLQVDAKGIRDMLSWNGYSATTCVVSPHIAEFVQYMALKKEPNNVGHVLAPMPGLIVEIIVSEGEAVKSGQSLMIIEAMKMENIIRARCDGIIEAIFVKKGESINLDQELMKIG